MYEPSGTRPCQYSATYGSEHVVWEWKEDERLREAWKKDATFLAACHRKGLGLAQGDVHEVVQKGWKGIGATLKPELTFARPVMLFRVQLVQRWTQYLGWLTPEELALVPVIPMPYSTVKRRMVLLQHLHHGLPVTQGAGN